MKSIQRKGGLSGAIVTPLPKVAQLKPASFSQLKTPQPTSTPQPSVPQTTTTQPTTAQSGGDTRRPISLIRHSHLNVISRSEVNATVQELESKLNLVKPKCWVARKTEKGWVAVKENYKMDTFGKDETKTHASRMVTHKKSSLRQRVEERHQ
jgi:hypothetical protein